MKTEVACKIKTYFHNYFIFAFFRDSKTKIQRKFFGNNNDLFPSLLSSLITLT